MRVPTIHNNGTSLEDLSDRVETAINALTDAVTALEQMAPNGRDYYPQGPEAITEATAEHRDRLRRVRGVLSELYEYYGRID